MVLSYQSRLGPSVADACLDFGGGGFGQGGVTNVAVVAPAFVVDGLETLEELEIELRETFMEAGGKVFRVVPCLNDEPMWVDGVHALIERAFAA